LVDPPDSLECPLRAVASGGVVDYTTMMLGYPEQETGPAASEPRASPRSSRSTTRAFGGSLPVHERAKKMGYHVRETHEGETIRMVLVKRTY